MTLSPSIIKTETEEPNFAKDSNPVASSPNFPPFFSLFNYQTLKPVPNSKPLPTTDNQSSVPDLNRIINEPMSEHCQGVEEVRLEPHSETMINAEPENHPEKEELVEKERDAKRQRVAKQTE